MRDEKKMRDEIAHALDAGASGRGIIRTAMLGGRSISGFKWLAITVLSPVNPMHCS